MRKIDSFRGKYNFLSNMYQRTFFEHGILYKSVEHYFQSHKTVDAHERDKIRCAKTPMDAKRLGRKCRLRSHWEFIKDDMMEEAIRLKFKSEDLRAKLIATHPCELVEGNYWGDTYWGVCNGRGQNKLGMLLMKIRNEFVSLQNELKILKS